MKRHETGGGHLVATVAQEILSLRLYLAIVWAFRL